VHVSQHSLLFEGVCCFFDEKGRVLYFAPTPQNEDSTQLSFALQQSTPSHVVAVFDGSRIQLHAQVSALGSEACISAHMLTRRCPDNVTDCTTNKEGRWYCNVVGMHIFVDDFQRHASAFKYRPAASSFRYVQPI